MEHRPIIGIAKSGSISRVDARQAAKAAKPTRKVAAVRKSTRGHKKPAKSTFWERYLGHFGQAASPAKKSSARKHLRKAS